MVWPCLTLKLCIGRAMPYLTMYVFVYMLHCNGRAMPDLKFVYRSGHALLFRYGRRKDWATETEPNPHSGEGCKCV